MRMSTDELWDVEKNCFRNRYRETIAFIDPKGRVADCGEPNALKCEVVKHFGMAINSIEWDFNYPHRGETKYDTILCFEILEHLFNPLTFLESMKSMLAEDGYIYLSTPYQRPAFLRGIRHFHEIPTDRLMWLFEAAGLEVVETGKATMAGNWYNHLKGVRSMLRYFQKTRLYKLRIFATSKRHEEGA